MNRTKIEYLDYTWNPIVGCSGFGCAVRAKCWAMSQAKRKKHECDACYSFTPHVHWERLEQPFQVKKPSRIGCCFMGELYDKEIAGNVRASIFMRIEKAFWHTFLIFTKQPGTIDEKNVPSNVWIAVSVNRKEDLWRIETLKAVAPNITVRAVSFEPLYENLGKIDLKGIDWIIIGAQTRPLLRPKEEWVYNIKCQAIVLGIPIFEKNNLGYSMPLKEFPKVDGGV